MAADDPYWPRASRWLEGDSFASPAARLAIVGIPLRLGSITPGRCDLAPQAMRAALARYSVWDFELAHDLRAVAASDAGDLDVAELEPEAAFDPVRKAILALPAAEAAVLLGGDNSITRPGLHGMGIPLARCALLTIDAHLDLRELGRLTNGNPVRALLADGLPGGHIVQAGIQSFANSPAYAEVARDAGITIITVEQARAAGVAAAIEDALERLAARADAIYVDLDLDVMDRAFAPGTPGSRPGGLLPQEVRAAARICGRHPKVRALDLVELDPERDIAGVTVLAGAACLLSFASGLLERR
jgi:formiminoglutamase